MKLQFLYDFGSPNAYLAHKIIPGIEARTGATFEYVPILLGGIFKLTNNRPPMIAFGEVKGKLAYEMRETERFIARHKITSFKFNPFFPVNTLTLMRIATGAGSERRVVDALFHHMWEAPKKMDDAGVIRAALLESGLDADALTAASQTSEVKQKLMAATEDAANRGVFGAPSFFVGSELFFGKDRLGCVEEEIVKAR